MLFSLTACGGSSEPPTDVEETEDDEEDDDNDKPDPDTNPDVVVEPVHYPGGELARKNVYKAEYLDIDISEDYMISSHGETEDGIWFVFTKYAGYGRGDETECKVMVIDHDGNVTEEFMLQDIPYDDPGILLDEHSIKYSRIDYYYFSDFNYTDDGVEVVFPIASYDSKDNRTLSVFDLRWDTSGKFLGSSILPVDAGAYGNLNTFTYTCDDELLVCYGYWGDGDEYNGAILLGKDRFESPKDSVLVESKSADDLGYNTGSIIVREDGVYLLNRTNTFSEGGVAEGKVDLSDLTVTYTGEVSQLGSGRSYAVGFDESGYFFHHFSGIEYASTDKKGRIILDFTNSDICTSGFGIVIPLDGLDKLFCVDHEGIKSRFMICTSVDPESIEECPVITLAYNYPGTELPEWIHEFNTSDNGCRIVVKDYSFFEERDNYYAWRDKLQDDMLNGRMCDITYLENMDDIDVRLLAESGLLADVGKLITDDPDMDLDDYAINVFEAASIDGKLFQVIPGFNVETVIGSANYMSGYENWMVDDFLALDEELRASGSHMFDPFVTRERFVDEMMHITGSSWVNLDAGTCDFTDPSFMKLLGYALSLSEYYSTDGYGNDYWEKEAELRENGNIRLAFTRITRPVYMVSNGYSTFNEKPVIVGFPSPDSEGSAIYYDYNMLLKADSEHLSEAWDLVKRFLLPEYQEDSYGMPVLLECLEQQMADCNEDVTTIDENGDSVTGPLTYYFNDEEYEVPQLSDSELKQYYDQLLSVGSLYFTDTVIIDMVKTAVSEGSIQGKTPEEIASQLQLQVLDYLREK